VTDVPTALKRVDGAFLLQSPITHPLPQNLFNHLAFLSARTTVRPSEQTTRSNQTPLQRPNTTIMRFIFVLPALSTFGLTTTIPRTTFHKSCDHEDPSVLVCAEVYNTTDCSGHAVILTGTVCQNTTFCYQGSIHVKRGGAFAGFTYGGCQYAPDVLAGPLWRNEDQGCQKFGVKKDVKSWRGMGE
jgi:hypothetical protein